MKVYELAKDLNLKSVELLDKLRKEHNMQVKNHMQSLSAEDVKKIKKFFQKPVVIKKKPVVKKKKSPKVSPAVTEKEKEEIKKTPLVRTKKVIRRRTAEKTKEKSKEKTKEKITEKTTDKAIDKTTEKTKQDRETSPVEEGEKESSSTPSIPSSPTHIRPGLSVTEGTDFFKKINEEMEKKKPKKTLEKEGQGRSFRAADFRKREMIFQPKKKRLSAGSIAKQTQITTPKSHKRLLKMYKKEISIEEIAQTLKVKKKLLIQKAKREGLFSDSLPTLVDYDTAVLICSLFDFEVKNMVKSEKEVMESLFFGNLSAKKQSKPPVVTVMGHVNHGKTTLLDYIRKSRTVEGEAGGITQHIGAYSVPVGKSFVTFIDTPGHSAFTAMRARGAKVTDIVVLVVSADDGLQPQTIEAIDHARNAKAPIIVALNKVDLPSADIDRTKKQLMEKELVSEEWGGDVIFCPISALKGEGIDTLLEHIQLVAEVNELKANPDRSAVGVVIESRLEKGKGYVMTLLVQEGTLKSGEVLTADGQVGRARWMTDDKGQRLSSAGPGKAVEISGFNEAVRVGEPFYVIKSEKEARRLILKQKQDETDIREETATEYITKQKKEKNKEQTEEQAEEQAEELTELLLKAHSDEVKTLNFILKTDVAGTTEAITHSIKELNTDKVKAKIIHSQAGAVNESDVLLAVAGGASLLCFNTSIDAKAQKHIQAKGIAVKSYKVIYDLLKDVEKMMAGALDPEIKETFGGTAEVQQVFPISRVGVIAGCKVTKGKPASHHTARLIREDQTIYEGKITSLKRFKESVKEVVEGQECGIALGAHKDFKVGDIIETFTQKEIRKETL